MYSRAVHCSALSREEAYCYANVGVTDRRDILLSVPPLIDQRILLASQTVSSRSHAWILPGRSSLSSTGGWVFQTLGTSHNSGSHEGDIKRKSLSEVFHPHEQIKLFEEEWLPGVRPAVFLSSCGSAEPLHNGLCPCTSQPPEPPARDTSAHNLSTLQY